MVWPKVAHKYDPLLAGSRDGSLQEPHDKAICRAMSAKYIPAKKGRPECTIFIGRLNKVTTEDEYAFCEFDDEKAATKACNYLNNSLVDDYKIYVDLECSRTWTGWIPRRLGGGIGGNKSSGQLRFGGETRPFRNNFELPEFSNTHRNQNRNENYRKRENSGETSERNDYRNDRKDRSRRSSNDRQDRHNNYKDNRSNKYRKETHRGDREHKYYSNNRDDKRDSSQSDRRYIKIETL